MLAKNFERDTNMRTERQSQPNQAEQIPLDNGAMAAEAAPDTDGYAHKYWAVTNHHRSNAARPGGPRGRSLSRRTRSIARRPRPTSQ